MVIIKVLPNIQNIRIKIVIVCLFVNKMNSLGSLVLGCLCQKQAS